MKLKSTILGVLVAFSTISYAQSGKVAQGDRQYERFAYADAINIYLKLLEKGYDSPDLYQKLASSYYFNADTQNAVKWYDTLAVREFKMPTDDYFRYAQSLRAHERYAESDSILNIFYAEKGDTYRLDFMANNKDYLDKIKAQSGRYEIQKLEINSGNSDFAPSFYKDRLVFASSRDSGVFTRNTHKWNNQPFLELYEVKISPTAKHSGLKKLKGINSRFHESTSFFTKDGTTVYFTRNNYFEGDYKQDKSGINRLKIFKATLDGVYGWGNITEIPFNSNEYSVAHPAFNAEGTKMYFVSDMPGGFGESDIWEVAILKSGRFGKPKNLGQNINTSGRETFPFIADSGELYFSSNGHPGLGGLDVFVAPNENDTYSTVYNLGTPINGADDDFSFIINSELKKGYYASNREGGMGDDDIYGVTELSPLVTICEQLIAGLVKEKDSEIILDGVQLEFYNDANEQITALVTDAKGIFDYTRDCKKNMRIKVHKDGYLPEELYLLSNTLGMAENLSIELEKEQQLVAEGADLGKILKLNPIYFDSNKAAITEKASYELSKVITALLEYPELNIDVRAHTDSRGKDNYNLKLSEKRANAIVKFIIANGINASRLTAKGYGETQPINECVNEVPCSREKLALNRRSEFIVVSK
jgi:outer membrane protein OmpA-like peptidoglycan-associated protein